MSASKPDSNKIIPGGVDEYIASFPKPIQVKLTELRKAVRQVAPDAIETVSYFGIPGYSYEGYDYNGMFTWFSYDNKDLRLHLRPPVLDDFAKDTKDYTKTKSILKFSPNGEVPVALIKKLVKASLEAMTGKQVQQSL